jgi:hypothetical protein
MPDERFLIQIIVDAQSKVAPVMKSISDAADGMAARMKLADTTVRQLDTHMEQLDNHVEKARNTMRLQGTQQRHRRSGTQAQPARQQDGRDGREEVPARDRRSDQQE